MDNIALFFAAPFAIVSVGLSLWWVCRIGKEVESDTYDNPDHWGV